MHLKIITILLLLVSSVYADLNSTDEKIKDAIVKIYTVSLVYDYNEPWNVRSRRSGGSGTIISNKRILTNAHVVANSSYIEVKRYGTTKRVRAKVLFVSHQADLAILSVDEKGFFDGVKPLEFDSIPNIQDRVTVYGFPKGGNTLSVTSGIVSRIEHSRYVHGGESFLAIQIDAAINPGNSGGPAISSGKIVGVVMQEMRRSQNIGYIVPTPMIKHFLDDIKDGRYDGFASMGVDTQSLENEAIREMYGMDKNSSGELVIDIVYNSSAKGILKKGDIITHIDGHKISNDGSVEFRRHQYTSYKYFIDLHQIGESVVLDIIRDKKPLKLKVKLTKRADDFLLVKTMRFDKPPQYFIYGGYVFVPLTRNLLSSTNRSLTKLRYLSSKWVTKEQEDVVLLLKVLASRISHGNYSISLWDISRVNGKKFASFKEFYRLVTQNSNKYVVLEDEDGAKVVINSKEAEKENPSIIARYGIKSDRSIDFRRVDGVK